MSEPRSLIHTAQHDECCAVPFGKAAFAGELDAIEAWTCPKCGTTWKREDRGEGIQHWSPQAAVLIF